MSGESFFFEVLIGGLLAGVKYSLVAMGFGLGYTASCVLNFAQNSAARYQLMFSTGWFAVASPITAS